MLGTLKSLKGIPGVLSVSEGSEESDGESMLGDSDSTWFAVEAEPLQIAQPNVQPATLPHTTPVFDPPESNPENDADPLETNDTYTEASLAIDAPTDPPAQSHTPHLPTHDGGILSGLPLATSPVAQHTVANTTPNSAESSDNTHVSGSQEHVSSQQQLFVRTPRDQDPTVGDLDH